MPCEFCAGVRADEYAECYAVVRAIIGADGLQKNGTDAEMNCRNCADTSAEHRADHRTVSGAE